MLIRSQSGSWLVQIKGIYFAITSDKQANLETLTKLPPQFIWENDSSLKFSSSLNLPNIQTMIDNFLNKDFTKSNEGVEDAVNQVQQIILKAAKSSLKLKLVKSRTKN